MMGSFDLHLVDFLLHRLTIYRHKRSLKPEHFKAWKDRYEFELIFGKKETAIHLLSQGLRMHFFKSNKLCFEIFKGFEEDEIDFLNRFLKPGDVFVDVGANMGLFSLYASQKVKPGGRVFAFEPSSITASRLNDNLQLNKIENVQIIKEGLSDKPGQLELIMAEEGYDAFNSFAKPSMGGIASSEKVPVTTFDDFMHKNSLSPADLKLVKVDVEGWEYLVFKGGEKTFSHPDAPVMLVEFTEQNAQNAKYSCAMISQLLHSFGYQLFIYDKKSRALTRELEGKAYEYQNLVAAKQVQRLSGFSIK